MEHRSSIGNSGKPLLHACMPKKHENTTPLIRTPNNSNKSGGVGAERVPDNLNHSDVFITSASVKRQNSSMNAVDDQQQQQPLKQTVRNNLNRPATMAAASGGTGAAGAVGGGGSAQANGAKRCHKASRGATSLRAKHKFQLHSGESLLLKSQFKIGRKIGNGSFGEIYAAIDTVNKCKVILSLILLPVDVV